MGLAGSKCVCSRTPYDKNEGYIEREYEKLGDDNNSFRSFYGIPRKEFSNMNFNQESAEAKREESWMSEQLPIQKEEEEKDEMSTDQILKELNENDNIDDSFVLKKAVATSTIKRMGTLGHEPTYVNI
mmetsp:Transcript_20679/g.26745  ORF Transcript_20679/g.26745 Transcript_20679/m.26745 type:complete len:128 (-) Transcript_20679:245-628(-)